MENLDYKRQPAAVFVDAQIEQHRGEGCVESGAAACSDCRPISLRWEKSRVLDPADEAKWIRRSEMERSRWAHGARLA